MNLPRAVLCICHLISEATIADNPQQANTCLSPLSTDLLAKKFQTQGLDDGICFCEERGLDTVAVRMGVGNLSTQ